MPFNSSSIIPTSSPLLCDSNASLYPIIFTCFEKHTTASLIFITFTITNVFLLPLYVLILWMGFHRWRYQCSVASGTISHSDILTFHIIILEIVGVLGSVTYCFAIVTCSLTLMMLGYFCFCSIYPAQTFFHCLACVERYVAVVHPITYRGLRHSDRVRVRNISIVCIWLLCITLVGSTVWFFPQFPTCIFAILHGIIMIVLCFCSLSVISTLIHLGLGKVGGGQEQMDQSKKMAFIYILAITGALVLRLCGLLIGNIIFGMEWEYESYACVVLMSGSWLCVPSSLVPLLFFLHRAGALTRFSRNLNEGGN